MVKVTDIKRVKKSKMGPNSFFLCLNIQIDKDRYTKFCQISFHTQPEAPIADTAPSSVNFICTKKANLHMIIIMIIIDVIQF